MGKLDGRVALVTGGGTGIGRAIALLFANEGADVCVIGRRERPLASTAAEIREIGNRVLYLPTDIASAEGIRFSVTKTVEQLGALDVLVNNASVVGQVGPVEDTDLDEWNKALAINLTGTMLCCRESIPFLRQSKAGAIVNVSSNVGRRGFPNRAPYVASKWAMQGLTQTLAHELGPDGIRVNAICPGPVMTERLEGSMRKMAEVRHVTADAVKAEWEAQAALGRFATSEECAKAALFFASGDSSGTTGQALNVTAGALIS